ncbi:MAG: hypothetical protein M3Z01_03370 [Thermoproteota archaeon]|nr:hypothetical protein [Thermoproteota archaeon]
MNEFSSLITDLTNNIYSNMEFFKNTLTKKPTLVYYKLNELANFVGSRYNLKLEIHFPDSSKIYSLDEYGKENISIVIDKFRKAFPIPREQIKQEAINSFKNATVIDAYMYEGKEGIKIIFNDKIRSRIEILPGSFHLWVKIDKDIEKFCNWLLLYVYSDRQ